MSNNFNISVAPEIAALEAKVDIIDTEVDTIRSTDIPATDALITAVDTVVDSIKIKTDAMPQTIRGVFTTVRQTTASGALVTLINLTGQGKLVLLTIACVNAGDTVEVKITLNGSSWSVVTHTGDTTDQTVIMKSSTETGNRLFLLPTPMTEPRIFDLEFSTSLLVEFRRSAGANDNVLAVARYLLDDF